MREFYETLIECGFHRYYDKNWNVFYKTFISTKMGQHFLLCARCGSNAPLVQLLIDSDQFFVKYFEVCDYEDVFIAKQVEQLVEDLRPDTRVLVLGEAPSLSE